MRRWIGMRVTCNSHCRPPRSPRTAPAQPEIISEDSDTTGLLERRQTATKPLSARKQGGRPRNRDQNVSIRQGPQRGEPCPLKRSRCRRVCSEPCRSPFRAGAAAGDPSPPPRTGKRQPKALRREQRRGRLQAAARAFGRCWFITLHCDLPHLTRTHERHAINGSDDGVRSIRWPPAASFLKLMRSKVIQQ
jgi:hypothetical protein